VDFPTYCALGKSSLPTAFGAEENLILKRKLLKLILHLKSDSTLDKLPIIIGAASPFYVNLKKNISLTLLSMPSSDTTSDFSICWTVPLRLADLKAAIVRISFPMTVRILCKEFRRLFKICNIHGDFAEPVKKTVH